MSISPTHISKDEELEWLREIAKRPSIADNLQIFSNIFPNKICFSTSFGKEDQVISDYIFTNLLPVRVFTLDTGRFFPETYKTWSETLEKYQQPLEVFFPSRELLEPFLAEKGPDSFYKNVENRMECCHIRKVEPLKRALKGQKLWVTGIRAGQSTHRTQLEKLEWDEENQLYKYHPLLNWTQAEIDLFICQNQIPVNSLHELGFVSIGCSPCTRAIGPGEDFRAGRWWWEETNKKECGLHFHKK